MCTWRHVRHSIATTVGFGVGIGECYLISTESSVHHQLSLYYDIKNPYFHCVCISYLSVIVIFLAIVRSAVWQFDLMKKTQVADSEFHNLIRGVPQGSTICPLLYHLFSGKKKTISGY